MKAINITKARADLFNIVESINENSVPIVLTNTKGKNVVLIGEDDWNSIQETIYLNSIQGMTTSLKKGMENSLKERIREEDVSW